MAKDEKLITIVPTGRQLAQEQMEFYAFFHFGMNTMTGREWGDGTEPEDLFDPKEMDAMQWAACVKDAGMKGAILTCKHHDGFCLWPSKYTDHSVRNSPYRSGQGDIVREVADALAAEGLKFGVYLSPWDRNHPLYGSGKPYDDYFVSQLTELLTGYGEIFCVWFDGACGEGPNGKRQIYDWDRYYECIRRLQPNANISVCGPDIRWCGNEAGDVRAAEWSVVPRRLSEAERVSAASQQADDTSFRERKLTSDMQDLGSRKVLRDEEDLIWYPAEVNTSIRPGWFYHSEEDTQVKSLEELQRIYLGSVGGNATFLLNIPPNRDGKIAPEDEARLHELGAWIRDSFQKNLAEKAMIMASPSGVTGSADVIRYDDYRSWYQGSTPNATIVLTWEEAHVLQFLELKEQILLSQRIESYSIELYYGCHLVAVYEGKTVGYCRIVPLHGIRADRAVIRVIDSRVAPTLSFVGVYE